MEFKHQISRILSRQVKWNWIFFDSLKTYLFCAIVMIVCHPHGTKRKDTLFRIPDVTSVDDHSNHITSLSYCLLPTFFSSPSQFEAFEMNGTGLRILCHRFQCRKLILLYYTFSQPLLQLLLTTSLPIPNNVS